MDILNILNKALNILKSKQDSKPLICEYIPYILSGGNIHYKPIHSIPSNNLDDNEIKNELFLLYIYNIWYYNKYF